MWIYILDEASWKTWDDPISGVRFIFLGGGGSFFQEKTFSYFEVTGDSIVIW